MIQERAFYVAGEWVRPSRGRMIAVVDPATGRPFASVPRGVAADARTAVHAARWAFDEGPWPRLRPAERASLLKRVAVEMALDRVALTDTLIRETGCPRRGAQSLLTAAPLDAMSWYADRAARDVESRLPDHPGPPATASLVTREPLGVVTVLGAAADPLWCVAHLVFASLAAGNTVVLKPSSRAPLTAFAFARAFARAGLPAGVVNVVAGNGAVAGAECASNAMVDAVVLAGRVSTGRRVAAAAAATLKRTVMAMGATGTAVALDGADPATVAPQIVAAWLTLGGRGWGAPCVTVATPSVHDALVDAIVHEVKALSIADPGEWMTDVGPLHESDRARIEALIEASVTEGATLAAGGSRPAYPAEGSYFAPAVLTGVASDAAVVRDEIAGPLLAVVAAATDDDALRIANARAGGVAAWIWSGSRRRSMDAARNVRAATISVEGGGANPWAPGGGYGPVGIGRVAGLIGIDELCEIKHIAGPS